MKYWNGKRLSGHIHLSEPLISNWTIHWNPKLFLTLYNTFKPEQNVNENSPKEVGTNYPLNYYMGIEAADFDPEDFADTNDGHSNYMNLLLSAKRSLQKYTPTLLKGARIDDDKLITEVLERNRRGQKKMIQKIVCPFCFTSVAPQNRSGTRRWDITNFNRHLIKIHGQHV